MVLNYQDSRIRYYKLKENGGQAAARNFGIEHASYDYIAFEDSDDIWHEDKLAIQMECLMNAAPEVGFVYHKIRYDMGNQKVAILPSEEIANEKKSGNAVNYLMASCYLLQKYKEDYLRTNTLNHRMEIILRDAERIGMKEQFVKLLELRLR